MLAALLAGGGACSDDDGPKGDETNGGGGDGGAGGADENPLALGSWLVSTLSEDGSVPFVTHTADGVAWVAWDRGAVGDPLDLVVVRCAASCEPAAVVATLDFPASLTDIAARGNEVLLLAHGTDPASPMTQADLMLIRYDGAAWQAPVNLTGPGDGGALVFQRDGVFGQSPSGAVHVFYQQDDQIRRANLDGEALSGTRELVVASECSPADAVGLGDGGFLMTASCSGGAPAPVVFGVPDGAWTTIATTERAAPLAVAPDGSAAYFAEGQFDATTECDVLALSTVSAGVASPSHRLGDCDVVNRIALAMDAAGQVQTAYTGLLGPNPSTVRFSFAGPSGFALQPGRDAAVTAPMIYVTAPALSVSPITGLPWVVWLEGTTPGEISGTRVRLAALVLDDAAP